MLTVGIDSIEINRIKKSLKRQSFINKVFSNAEQTELEAIDYREQTAAGIFAAKEAFFKAIKTGIFRYPLNELSILHAPDGSPYILLDGTLKESVQGDFCVSITHTKTTATAIVIGDVK